MKRIPNLGENVFIVDCELSHERYGALNYRIFQASTDCVPRPFGVLRLKISGGAGKSVCFDSMQRTAGNNFGYFFFAPTHEHTLIYQSRTDNLC